MADWRLPADSAVDPDAPVTSDLMYSLRDNPIAIAEGAAGAPRIRDAAMGTTVTAAGIDWVAKRIIGAAWNGLGQTVMAVHTASTTSTISPGTTVLGSDLTATNSLGMASSVALPGSWRLQGYVATASGGSAFVAQRTSIWLRIL